MQPVAEPPAWRFWQVFGEEQASRADEIQEGARTALAFTQRSIII